MRTPKIVPTQRARRAVKTHRVFKRPPRKLTQVEKIYDIIYDNCVIGFRFVEAEYGMPIIEASDIEEKSEGIYVVRFRCEPRLLHNVYFFGMAKDVCDALRSGMHFDYAIKSEYGIPYAECAWVLQIKELSEQENINQENNYWRKFFMAHLNQTPSKSAEFHEQFEAYLAGQYNRTLASLAEELGYAPKYIDILSCDANDKQQKKKVYIQNKAVFDAGMQKVAKGRNILDVFKNALALWLGEDLFMRALMEYGFEARLRGAPSGRTLLGSGLDKSFPTRGNIVVGMDGRERELEIQYVFTPIGEVSDIEVSVDDVRRLYEGKKLLLVYTLAENKFLLIDFMRETVHVVKSGDSGAGNLQDPDRVLTLHPIEVLWETLRDVLLCVRPEPAHGLDIEDSSTGEHEVLGIVEGHDGEDDASDSDILGEEIGYGENPEEQETEETGDEVGEASDAEPAEGDENGMEGEMEIPVADDVGVVDEEEVGDAEEGHIEEEVEETEPKEVEEPAPVNQEDEVEPEAESTDTDIGLMSGYTAEQWAALNDGF